MAFFNRPNYDTEWFSTGNEASSSGLSTGQWVTIIVIIDLILLLSINSLREPDEASRPTDQATMQQIGKDKCLRTPRYGGGTNGGLLPNGELIPCGRPRQ